jgi:hypothetical protein
MSNNLQQQLPYRPVPQQQGIPTAPPLQTALNRPQCAFPTIPGKRKKKTVLQKEDQTVINDKHPLATPLTKRRLFRAKRKLRNRQPDTTLSLSLKNPRRGAWKRLKSKKAIQTPSNFSTSQIVSKTPFDDLIRDDFIRLDHSLATPSSGRPSPNPPSQHPPAGRPTEKVHRAAPVPRGDFGISGDVSGHSLFHP